MLHWMVNLYIRYLIDLEKEMQNKATIVYYVFAKVTNTLSAKTNPLIPYHSGMNVKNVKVFAHKSPKD